VQPLAANFSRKLSECLSATESRSDDGGASVCMSDQVIMTKLLLEHKDNFNIISRHYNKPMKHFGANGGYGAVATAFLTEPVPH